MAQALIHKISPLLSPSHTCPDSHHDQVSLASRHFSAGHLPEDGKLKCLCDRRLPGRFAFKIRKYSWDGARSARDAVVQGTVARRGLLQQTHFWLDP